MWNPPIRDHSKRSNCDFDQYPTLERLRRGWSRRLSGRIRGYSARFWCSRNIAAITATAITERQLQRETNQRRLILVVGSGGPFVKLPFAFKHGVYSTIGKMAFHFDPLNEQFFFKGQASLYTVDQTNVCR